MKNEEDNENFQRLDVDISFVGGSIMSDKDDENDDEDSYGKSSSLDQEPLPCIVDLKTSGWDDDAISKCFEFAIDYGELVNVRNVFEPVVNKSLKNDNVVDPSQQVYSAENLEIRTEEKCLQVTQVGHESSDPCQNLDEAQLGVTNLPLPRWAL